jgi:hypothetical protein
MEASFLEEIWVESTEVFQKKGGRDPKILFDAIGKRMVKNRVCLCITCNRNSDTAKIHVNKSTVERGIC